MIIMSDRIESTIRYYLRLASDMGNRGFYYELDEPKQNEDWQSFEDEGVEQIMEAINDR